MKKDKIYKSGRYIRIRLSGVDLSLVEWVKHPWCVVTGRQLRRRASEYLHGKSNKSVRDIVTTTCVKQKPSEQKKRKVRRPSNDYIGIKDRELHRAVCGRWR